jgi:hypothetical protein
MKFIPIIFAALLIMFASTSAISAPAFLKAPSATAKVYRPVILDPKKLKVPLATALLQFPGEEIILPSDVNSAVIAPNFLFINAFGYWNNAGFPNLVKVDGIKDKVFANFKVTTIGGRVELARTLTVSFIKRTTEFGFRLLPGRSDLALVDAFDVTVNGVYLGRKKLPPYVISYIGVSDPNGLTTVVFRPVKTAFQTGAWVGREIYTK